MRIFIVAIDKYSNCNRFSSFLPSIINHLFSLLILFSIKKIDLRLLSPFFRTLTFIILWRTYGLVKVP